MQKEGKIEYKAEKVKVLKIGPGFRDAEKWEIEEVDFYIKTHCVHDYYLKNVLGDQSIAIRVMPEYNSLN